jgi:hypothetical protein
MTNMMSDGIIELVRRSSVKHPRAKSVLDADPKFQTKKKNLGDNAVAGIGPEKNLGEANKLTPQEKTSKSAKQKRDKKKYIPHPPPHIAAVANVNRERKKEGLPESTVEEMAMIEERLARKDLAKGGSIKSDIDSYLDTQSFSRKIVTANWADRVAKELVEWINKPRSPEEVQPMKITEFFREKGIFHRDFYLLAKKHDILQKALDYALQALGDIRERNVLEGKWNPNAGMFMMGHYDENWRKEQERREAAKVKQAEATGVDFKALMLDMTAPVAPTEEVRAKLESDKKRIEE